MVSSVLPANLDQADRPFVRPRRLAAFITAAAVGLASVAVAAVPMTAHAAGGTWSTSFENGQPTPPTDNYVAASNIGAAYMPGSVAPSITNAQASAEYAPNEVVAKLHDGDAGTKWLAFVTPSGGSPIELTYTLSSARIVKSYRLTSGNDAPERDPKAWEFQARNGSGNWTNLNTQSNQTFSARGQHKVISIASNNTAYNQYRLRITENGGDSRTQLAQWDLSDGTSTTVTRPMTLVAGGGPASGYNIKGNLGWTGTRAMQYAGSVISDGTATATNIVAQGLSIPVGPQTELSYKIIPTMNAADLRFGAGEDATAKYPSTYAAVDLEFSDGTRASTSNLTDQYGFPSSARGQGEAKVLYGNQWNSVKVKLTGLNGKTITRVLMTYDNPRGRSNVRFGGWVDDIQIKDVEPIDGSSLTHYVDTRRGTNSSGGYSRGNNIPATAWPNGFNFITPMTDALSRSWLYNYQASNDSSNKTRLQGMGVSHESSPWMGDRAQFVVMPDNAGDRPSGNVEPRSKGFLHADEVAQPDYYKVALDNSQVIEATPTDHGGIFRFTSNNSESSMRILLDTTRTGDGQLNINGRTVTGWVEGGSGLSVGHSRMFIAGTFDVDPTVTGSASARADSAYGSFPLSSSDRDVELRWATSFISLEQAQKNLAREVTGKSFQQIRTAAQQAWNDRLSVIDVSGSNATDVERVNLYSDLYRLNLYPNSHFEDVSALGSSTPQYKYASPMSQKQGGATSTQTNAQIKDGKMYVNNGFWDTYRTAWPLYAFLYPDLSEELINGFVQQYRDAGWISRWSSPGYADLMTGTSSDAAFAEAYTSGAISTALAKEAYAAGLKNATALPSANTPAGSSSNQVGRKGLDRSIFLGYTPDSQGESVSWGLEGYINDYGLAKMAEKLSQATSGVTEAERKRYKDEALYFETRAQDYANIFDPRIGNESKGFFQGRNVAGDWSFKPGTFGDSVPRSQGIYNPEDWDLGRDYIGGNRHLYTETDGWNFAFHAPFDVDGLAALYGGKQGLQNKLNAFYTTPERAWSRTIHEVYEARDVRIGQFGMSNQVSHHIPYISAAAGDPTTTQEIVSEVMQRLFTGSDIGQGYPGDEDNGEMSSWYILSAMGFYPLELGSGQYQIGTPLLDRMVIRRGAAHGGNLLISAPGNNWSKPYVSGVSLKSGSTVTQLSTTALSQAALRNASELTFTMSATPSTWGSVDIPAQAPMAHRDVLKDGAGSIATSAGDNTANMFDDWSGTQGSFNNQAASITWTASSGTVKVGSYTLTNGSDRNAGSPQAWTFQGFDPDTGWRTLDQRSGESFVWNRQTRPFIIANPGDYTRYRLSITATNNGSGARLSEVEFLTAPLPVGGTLAPILEDGISAQVGLALTRNIGTVSGLTSTTGLTATINYGDGTGSRPLATSYSQLTGVVLKANHTYSSPGLYDVTVTVTHGGQSKTARTRITVSRQAGIQAYYNNACTTVLGTAADCDGLGYALDRSRLSATGFTPGQTSQFTAGGATMRFAVPATAPGTPDNIVALGQTIPLNLGAGATRLSFLGTANESGRQLPATLHYSDGTNSTVQIGFGDWVGAASSPQYSNTVLATSNRRLLNAVEGDTQTAAIFATAPTMLPTGKTAIAVTLPNLAQPINEGQLHIFGVATDGTVAATQSLNFAAAATATANTGQASAITLGQASGGNGSPVRYAATVNWGDGTAVTNASVSGGAITASHTFAAAGTYLVTTVVDDGHVSTTGTTVVIVTAGGGNPGGGDDGDDGDNPGGGDDGGDNPGGDGGDNPGGDGGNNGGGTPGGGSGVTTPQVGVPTISAAKQPFNVVAKKRVRVSAVAVGVPVGTRVTFKSGTTVLGIATTTRSGTSSAVTATTVIPAKLRVGTYKGITATVVVAGKTVVSPASGAELKVVKAKTKKVTVKGKAFKAGARPKVTVKVKKLTNGRHGVGRIQIRVGKKVVTRVKLTKKRKGKVSVTLPKRYSSSIKVRAKFVPKVKKNVKAKQSKRVTVKARR